MAKGRAWYNSEHVVCDVTTRNASVTRTARYCRGVWFWSQIICPASLLAIMVHLKSMNDTRMQLCHKTPFIFVRVRDVEAERMRSLNVALKMLPVMAVRASHRQLFFPTLSLKYIFTWHLTYAMGFFSSLNGSMTPQGVLSGRSYQHCQAIQRFFFRYSKILFLVGPSYFLQFVQFQLRQLF